MPSYDYRCQSCREHFTVERSMSDSSETNCTACGSGDVSRIWNMNFRTSGKTADVGQSSSSSSSSSSGSGCGSHACGGGGCH